MPFSPRFTRVDEKGIIALKYPIITKAYNVEKASSTYHQPVLGLLNR